MKKTVTMLKQIELDADSGIFIIEFFNHPGGTYDYYITGFSYPLTYVVGVPDGGRLTKRDIINLYRNGYFDSFISEIIGN